MIDDKVLGAPEIVEMFKACLSVIDKPYDESEVKDIVEALWEDGGLDSQKNGLEIREVRSLFSSHEGLNEGLMKRYVQCLATQMDQAIFNDLKYFFFKS